MRTVIYSIDMSLNGCVHGPDGSFDGARRTRSCTPEDRALEPADLGQNARLAIGSVADEVRAIGDGVIGVGGATLPAALAREDLIDEYHVFVYPVLVGGGRRCSRATSRRPRTSSSSSGRSPVT